jgi:hypothetical protein
MRQSRQSRKRGAVHKQSWFKVATAAASLCFAGAAYASETTTYTYDSRGRLVKVEHAGSVNDGITTQYGLDKADNRTNVTVNSGDTILNC